MSPSNFLVRGLLAGLIAGLAAFAVGYVVGEPQVEAGIRVEEAHTAHAHHATEPGTTEVSRKNQSTWGLLTGTASIGVALGGLTAIGAAFALGRIGNLKPPQTTALVALLGFVSIGLVPFLKYPANPPGASQPGTIGDRTTFYFSMLGISVAAIVAAVTLGAKLARKTTGYRAAVIAAMGYLVIVIAAGEMLPTVNEAGAFPADRLWYFRRESIVTTATLWAVLGVALTGLIGRLHDRESAAQARRELAASL